MIPRPMYFGISDSGEMVVAIHSYNIHVDGISRNNARITPYDNSLCPGQTFNMVNTCDEAVVPHELILYIS